MSNFCGPLQTTKNAVRTLRRKTWEWRLEINWPGLMRSNTTNSWVFCFKTHIHNLQRFAVKTNEHEAFHHSHLLHVCNIYEHLSHKWPKSRLIFHIYIYIPYMEHVGFNHLGGIAQFQTKPHRGRRISVFRDRWRGSHISRDITVTTYACPVHAHVGWCMVCHVCPNLRATPNHRVDHSFWGWNSSLVMPGEAPLGGSPPSSDEWPGNEVL